MAREIKFRAWDKRDLKMDAVAIIDFSNHLIQTKNPSNNEPSNDRYKLMQFTGLLDKNGKEIYEGDIVECGGYITKVVWNIRFSSFCLRKNGWMFDHFFGEAQEPEDSEVIGNIYTNPELLEAKP